MPSSEINAGVIDRFHREGLTEMVELPSPHKSHKGGTCRHERITDAGRSVLAGRSPQLDAALRILLPKPK